MGLSGTVVRARRARFGLGGSEGTAERVSVVHLCLCVLHRRGLNLRCCAIAVWAAENFG